MIVSPRFIGLLFVLLLLALSGVLILFLFWKKLYSRLSARLTAFILASGLITLIIWVVINEVSQDIEPSTWFRLLQTALLILSGPIMLGFLTARFIRLPLRQFNDAVASLKQNHYKTKLSLTGIHEFDEVFTKLNDLTDRLQREEELRKDLVSDTSHELNTPLTTMIGQLTAMQEGKHPMTTERITLLKEQAERLAELVHQLDAYTKARISESREPEDIPLKQLCQRLTAQFAVELKQKGIATKLNIADDFTLHANRDAVQGIITNLMQNALRYSKATEITIDATARQLTFADNGKGVPPDNLPYLFERFYRIDTSRNRNTGGLGLGLAIVQELATGQDWTIHAKNTHPGLMFTLTF